MSTHIPNEIEEKTPPGILNRITCYHMSTGRHQDEWMISKENTGYFLGTSYHVLQVSPQADLKQKYPSSTTLLETVKPTVNCDHVIHM